MDERDGSSWESLNISHRLICLLIANGFITPTAIQRLCIRQFSNHKDVACEAVTGSGKTLAFVITVFECLERLASLDSYNGQVYSVIIAPTRELAQQIFGVVTIFCKDAVNINCCKMIGGRAVAKDISDFNLNRPNIVIGTPGRLEHLLTTSVDGFSLLSKIKQLEFLIIDEADRLLDMGFDKSLNAILSCLPKQRRTGLFSATLSDRVCCLVKAGLRDAIFVRTKQQSSSDGGGGGGGGSDRLSNGTEAADQGDPAGTVPIRTPLQLQNFYMLVDHANKFDVLVQLVRQRRNNKNIVFFDTCSQVDYFGRALQALCRKAPVWCMHGKQKDRQRQAALKSFLAAKSGTLVATDVLSRGIDVPSVDWVLQFDAPVSTSAFVHRCGRTARIGQHGSALLLLYPNERSYVQFICANQKTILQPHSPLLDAERPQAVQWLRQQATKDRAVMERGINAFVAFIQAYCQHECDMLFKIKDLDVGELANGYGLLRLPKMRELGSHPTLKNFKKPSGIVIREIPYQDKVREAARLARIAVLEEVDSVKSEKGAAVKQRIERRRGVKTKRELNDVAQDHSGRIPPAISSDSHHFVSLNDSQHPTRKRLRRSSDDELGDDYRLLRKVRRGRASERDLDCAFGLVKPSCSPNK